jgi:hypothetical protein
LPEHSEDFFYLIDHDGNRRVPVMMTARDGRCGFAVHPKGSGNDASAAEYTSDGKRMVQAVVLHGLRVRCRAKGGPQDGHPAWWTRAIVHNRRAAPLRVPHVCARKQGALNSKQSSIGQTPVECTAILQLLRGQLFLPEVDSVDIDHLVLRPTALGPPRAGCFLGEAHWRVKLI